MWASTDAGRTWGPTALRDAVWAVFASPAEPATVYAERDRPYYAGDFRQASGQAHKSPDGGRTWETVGTPGMLKVLAHVDPYIPECLYGVGPAPESSDARELFESHDDGSTWSRLLRLDASWRFTALIARPGNPSLRHLAVNGADGGWKGTGGIVQLLQSEDSGTTWAALPVLDGLLAVAADPATAAGLWGAVRRGTEQQLWHSGDAGRSWEARHRLSYPWTHRLLVHPVAPSWWWQGGGHLAIRYTGPATREPPGTQCQEAKTWSSTRCRPGRPMC
ncbi:MAG: hypothetical protein AB1505_17370 [Candidatus Latescibacterota bacterium]